jgi:hypothetical protein
MIEHTIGLDYQNFIYNVKRLFLKIYSFVEANLINYPF